MSELSLITSIFGSLKTASDIVKIIKDTDVSFQNAEFKMKAADLLNSLADAKIQMSEIQDEIKKRDLRIEELENALEAKFKLIKNGDAYYELDDQNRPIGNPYCIRCWEMEHRLYHLISNVISPRDNDCPVCKSHYRGNRTRIIRNEDHQHNTLNEPI